MNTTTNNHSNFFFSDSVNALAENPVPRVPIALCLDVSGSMLGKPMTELNEGVRLFYEAVKEDETARYAADIAVVTFADQAECVSSFRGVDEGEVPELEGTYGMTSMGEGVRMCLDMLDARLQEYKQAGVEKYKPWLVVMTDGHPNGDESVLEQAVKETADRFVTKQITVFPLGIGDDADMQVLGRFSPGRPPLHLKGLKFREFFTWLSQSVSAVSQSMPDDEVKLDLEGIQSWGSI